MFVVMVLKMLTRTKKTVMRRVILDKANNHHCGKRVVLGSPARDDVRRYKEGDPGDDDKHPGWQVAGDNVVRHLKSFFISLYSWLKKQQRREKCLKNYSAGFAFCFHSETCEIVCD